MQHLQSVRLRHRYHDERDPAQHAHSGFEEHLHGYRGLNSPSGFDEEALAVFLDAHPASSKLDIFEGFTKNIITALQANPALWASTAVFITFDEGGGYYDSGYVQPVDFFGDGTRIPLLIVSPYSTGGIVSHSYSDHVSLIKFIEKNWGLSPLTNRSRDNMPNPTTSSTNPYVPLNSPAIDDLFSAFNFSGNKR